MDGHGYQLTSNSKSAAVDYMPGLVGTDTVNPNANDIYFDRFEFTGAVVSSLITTRWVADGTDPIYGVKLVGGKSFYLPLSELKEIADDATLSLVKAMAYPRRFA